MYIGAASRANVLRDDLVVELREAALLLLDQLRIEATVSVSGIRQRDRAGLRQCSLAAAAVPVVAGRLFLLGRRMNVDLRIQHALGQFELLAVWHNALAP